MINNWMVPRNKRKLYPAVDILSLFTLQNMGDVWQQDLDRQLNFEAELERYGIKREGQRRDRRAGGARTYESWLYNLGLIYIETNSGIIRTTLAGEALLAGESPVPVITNQLMKLQYPSPYSNRTRVRINERFQIRPFRFILRLLTDERIQHLSKQEIGRLVITEGENETQQCFEHVVRRILDYRNHGVAVLPADLAERHASSTTGIRTIEATISYLDDIGNTLINYLEYTQLITRNSDQSIFINPERTTDVISILADGNRLRPYDRAHQFGEENFQRQFGLAPGQNRDTRTFGGQAVTASVYRQRRIRSELLHIAGSRPVSTIDTSLISEIAVITGYNERQVEDALNGFRPDTFSAFEASYLNMAISGTELAREFEIATTRIFNQLGFSSDHVGTNPLHPDIFVESPLNYSGIIDTKAYRSYSISNDHRNRMIRNYIPHYQQEFENIEFFMYVADGFGVNINTQVRQVASQSGVDGTVITARNLLRLLQRHLTNQIDHQVFRRLFRNNQQISIQDIEEI